MEQSIYFVGTLGLTETLEMIDNKGIRQRLEERFPISFFRIFENIEEKQKINLGISGLWPLVTGGFYPSLNEFPADDSFGFLIYLNRVPILQETIEICEFLKINPYKTFSKDCYLLIPQISQDQVGSREDEFKGKIIGKLTTSNEKILFRGEEKHYFHRTRILINGERKDDVGSK